MIILRSRACLAFGSLFLAISTAHSAQAEQLSSEWQGQRDYYNFLSDEACAGDRPAYETLHDLAMRERNPVAMNDLAWVYLTEECPYYQDDSYLAVALQLEAAEAGYPIATNAVAHRYMLGDGVTQNIQTSLEYFNRAISMDHGSSAIDLAHYYLDGDHLPVDYYRAVDLLDIAQETFGNPGGRPSPTAIAELAQALDEADASIVGEQPLSQDARWRYEDNRASWGYVSGGRLRAEVFVEADSETGQIFFGLDRISNDPMIHFMGASVEDSAGKKQEIHFGKCGANNCLQLSSRDFATDTTYLSIPIIPAAQQVTLEAMKSGSYITFRYQTRDVLTKHKGKFETFTLGLKGSRAAIEEVERSTALIETRAPAPRTNPSTSSAASQQERAAVLVEGAATTASGNAVGIMLLCDWQFL
jgi:hypothetical protein